MSIVLDASALLAYLHQEAGGSKVRKYLAQAHISSVNWSEVVQKALTRRVDIRGMREDVVELGLSIMPFTVWQAELAGRLAPRTSVLGLSLGDRSCLALALDLGFPVLTADRIWRKLAIELDIRFIR